MATSIIVDRGWTDNYGDYPRVCRSSRNIGEHRRASAQSLPWPALRQGLSATLFASAVGRRSPACGHQRRYAHTNAEELNLAQRSCFHCRLRPHRAVLACRTSVTSGSCLRWRGADRDCARTGTASRPTVQSTTGHVPSQHAAETGPGAPASGFASPRTFTEESNSRTNSTDC
jgi:hypothetical protein